MTSELQQIKDSFETLGFSVEEISKDRGLELEAVKAGLMQCSPKYRKLCGKEDVIVEDGLNFTDEQLSRVNEVIFELAVASEDEHLRFKAATYVRDDKKGRKEIIKAQQQGGFNILQINNLIQEAREAKDRMLGGQKQRAINV